MDEKQLNNGVTDCARCGQNHPDGTLIWKRFDRPIHDSDGDWYFWATCPNTGDPILLRREVIEDKTSWARDLELARAGITPSP